MTWEHEILGSSLAGFIKSEYSNLLKIHNSDKEVERVMIEYITSSIAIGSDDEGHAWLALALVEWKYGRLSDRVKECAIYWVQRLTKSFSANALNKLEKTLTTPMPPRKNFVMQVRNNLCPWPAGSLLAYQITSSDHPHVTKSPFWMKYVLLQVFAIRRIPISRLIPDEAWNETMLVRLYNWYGESIPDISNVKSLQYTPIVVANPIMSSETARTLIGSIPANDNLSNGNLFERITAQRIEEVCCLDWNCHRSVSRKSDVFTYLGTDPNYSMENEVYVSSSITDYSICHSIPFDAILVNRLYQLTKSYPIYQR